MFKKINKNAIKQATQSNEALLDQLQECRRYATAYAFCFLLFAVAVGTTLFLDGNFDQKVLIIFGILLVSIASGSASNGSRRDLLEAIAALRTNSTDLPTNQIKQDAALRGND